MESPRGFRTRGETAGSSRRVGRFRWVAPDEHEHSRQDDRDHGWAVVRDYSLGRKGPDDRRAGDEDRAEHQDDSKPPSRETQLSAEASRTKRKHRQAKAEQDYQPKQEAAHDVSLSGSGYRPESAPGSQTLEAIQRPAGRQHDRAQLQQHESADRHVSVDHAH